MLPSSLISPSTSSVELCSAKGQELFPQDCSLDFPCCLVPPLQQLEFFPEAVHLGCFVSEKLSSKFYNIYMCEIKYSGNGRSLEETEDRKFILLWLAKKCQVHVQGLELLSEDGQNEAGML